MKPPLYFPPSLLAAARRAGIDVAAQYPNHEVMAQSEIPVDPVVNAAIQQTAFDRLAYQRTYMKGYMRKRRAANTGKGK